MRLSFIADLWLQEYDIVESKSFFEEAGRAAGFRKIEVVCSGSKGLRSSVTVFSS